MRENSTKITNEILQFIDQHNLNLDKAEYEDDYNRLALELFQYQFQTNLPYKKFCQARKKTPLTVKHWEHIPPMPIQVFKHLPLSCEPIQEAQAVFMTSGTTNPDAKGKNYHPVLSVSDASMKGPFKQFVLPDCDRMTIFVLSPAEDLNKHSSLSRYLTNAVTYYGTDKSRFFFTEHGLNVDELIQAIRACEAEQEPVMLMGATFAYVHILDYMKERGLQFHLPKGSRIFDTGGFKGQSREVEMDQLYGLFSEQFHVDRNRIINMYGMTELSSQIYDQTIQSSCLNGTAIHDKKGPSWVKTLVLNTDTLEPVEDGAAGVLAHYDLANWNSCLAILTEDMGYKTEHGFVLLGRIQGSEARGCSIAVDQLLQSNLGGVQR
ncbi:coenzyme F390 synthetase [Peribacillus kribbensis]|uniref:LuxE/PaaK family acyltransferase n=1 Tax=Peribacillus kribbensis TaxID=356658 RepID=UPI0003FA4088|nr:coenzyme F390 synthetase [Peribacillus kribbensis]